MFGRSVANMRTMMIERQAVKRDAQHLGPKYE